MANIDLSGRVAIVTGAGNGLGRAYAVELARRGAKIVVQDLGTSVNGQGSSSDAANETVEEIKRAGGEAVASVGSVTSMDDMKAMADLALERYGRIDIMVANAGIVRDSSFKKLAIEDFELVVNVHLLGTARAAKAVWNTMSDAGYGRLVFTTSTAGLFGNFGQSNYAAAKAGIVGLMNSLKVEGAKYDIKVNCISPYAATRMSEAHFPGDMAEKWHPRYVAAGVAFLASEQAPTGAILNTGGGLLTAMGLVERPGMAMPLDQVSAENIASAWPSVADDPQGTPFDNAVDHAVQLLSRLKA
jgi:NAD(P)-dependent dehydrogenase (short-subunit alcohol dehydrogenase family)